MVPVTLTERTNWKSEREKGWRDRSRIWDLLDLERVLDNCLDSRGWALLLNGCDSCYTLDSSNMGAVSSQERDIQKLTV